MLNKELQAETKVDSEQMPIVGLSSPNAAKPLVVGSAYCQQGYKGACCCNCKYQLKLLCHPMNGSEKFDKIQFGKGSIMQQCGWACVNPEICEGKSAIFFDKEHGMCECWSLRS